MQRVLYPTATWGSSGWHATLLNADLAQVDMLGLDEVIRALWMDVLASHLCLISPTQLRTRVSHSFTVQSPAGDAHTHTHRGHDSENHIGHEAADSTRGLTTG